MITKNNFALLFKMYRLRSGIATLVELGDLMAEKGVVYDNTVFSLWQSGRRIPHKRSILLVLIDVFVNKGGIQSLYEANKLMESADLRDINSEEVKNFSVTMENDHFHLGLGSIRTV